MNCHFPHSNHRFPSYNVVSFLLFIFATMAPLCNVQAGLPDSKNEILQFNAAGHVLGFEHDGVYIAGGNHMLKVEFAGTPGVMPATANTVTDGSGSQLLTRVAYNDLWPGINLVYKTATGGIVESTWQIAPGTAPEQIRLRYNAPVEIDTRGNLKINYETGWMSESAPIAWQQIDGRRIPVQVAFNIIETPNSKAIVTGALWCIHFCVPSSTKIQFRLQDSTP